MQDCLGGTAATMLICNLSPGSKSYNETLSSLRFADRVKHVKNESNVIQRVKNDQNSALHDHELRSLQAQILSLQRSLLESQKQNQHLKSQLISKNQKKKLRQKHQNDGWCPHCDCPLGDVNV
jgi:hypothetical protein